MNRYGKRCVLYPRVSTEMQVDGYSLEGQKNMLTRFADREEMIVLILMKMPVNPVNPLRDGLPFKKCSEILRMAWTLTIF